MSTEFSDLKGKIIREIQGCKKGSDTIIFKMFDGAEYVLSHTQD